MLGSLQAKHLALQEPRQFIDISPRSTSEFQKLSKQHQREMASPAHCYKPITASHEVRLLHLESGRHSDIIRGRLEHVNIGDNPVYEALSYEWGRPEKQCAILLETDGTRSSLDITRSLHTALRDLRHKDPTSGSRIIWADGVCINQEDIKEREQQACIMGPIYQNATRVVTYIGPHAENSNTAIDFAYDLWEICGMGRSSSTSRAGQFSQPIAPDTSKIPALSDPRCIALKILLLRGWASRSWCGQEFLLNKELSLMCGDREIEEWYLLPGIVQPISSLVLPAYLLPSSLEDPDSLRECLVGFSKPDRYDKDMVSSNRSPLPRYSSRTTHCEHRTQETKSTLSFA